jgi:hypothetical protein
MSPDNGRGRPCGRSRKRDHSAHRDLPRGAGSCLRTPQGRRSRTRRSRPRHPGFPRNRWPLAAGPPYLDQSPREASAVTIFAPGDSGVTDGGGNSGLTGGGGNVGPVKLLADVRIRSIAVKAFCRLGLRTGWVSDRSRRAFPFAFPCLTCNRKRSVTRPAGRCSYPLS